MKLNSIIVALVASIVLLVCLFIFGPSGYRYLKSEVFLYRSAKAWEKEDINTAYNWAALAYQNNPQSQRATGMLGDIGEREGSPQTLLWRQRLVQLSPNEVAPALALANSALLQNNVRVAEQALERIQPLADKRADYHSLRAGCFLKKGAVIEADKALVQAMELEPENPIHAVNLAVFRLKSQDPAQVSEALKALEKWELDPTFVVQVKRALRDHALSLKQWEKAEKLCRWFVGRSEANLDDRLRYHYVLQMTASPEQEAFEEETRQFLLKQPNYIAKWLEWMTTRKKGQEALEWLDGQDTKLTQRRDIKLAVAQIKIQNSEWLELRTFLAKENFGRLDFIRQLLLLRVKKELEPETFPVAWQRFVDEMMRQPDNLYMCLQIIQTWGWVQESNDVWWRRAGESLDVAQPALEHLRTFYASQKNAQGLLKVERKRLELFPQDDGIAANVAYLSLLLKIRANVGRDLAQTLDKKHPQNPSIAATQALSCYLQGLTQAGLQALSKVPTEQAQNPMVTFTRVLLLAQKGDKEKAKELAQKIRQETLLPEEKILLEQALNLKPLKEAGSSNAL